MSKLTEFVARNQDRMMEDAGVRSEPAPPPKASKLDGRVRLQGAAAIALDKIVADAQHREAFDDEALHRLAESLKTEGQLQPCRVRWDENRNVYVIIAGERRLRAARLAGLTYLECVVAEGPVDDATILRQQVVENALREDLRPVEKAKAFKAVMDLEGLDGKGLAERLHIDPSTVSRTLALLKLSEDVQRQVDAGDLPPTIAIKQPVTSAAKGKGKPNRGGSRGSREHTLRLSGGVAVVVKGRRNLTTDEVAAALREALAGLGGEARAA